MTASGNAPGKALDKTPFSVEEAIYRVVSSHVWWNSCPSRVVRRIEEDKIVCAPEKWEMRTILA